MDCSVICHGQIRLTGRKGSIIGGKVQAIRGLIATSLGNDAEKRTEIFVGAGIDVYSRLRVMEKKIETTREELAKIEEGLEKFEILSKERGVSYTNDPRRTSLLRIKIKGFCNACQRRGGSAGSSVFSQRVPEAHVSR